MKPIAAAAAVALLAGLLGGFLTQQFLGPKEDKGALKADELGALKSRADQADAENAALKESLESLRRDVKRIGEAARAAAQRTAEQPTAMKDEKKAAAIDAPKSENAPTARTTADWVAEIKAAKNDRAKFDQLWKEARDAKMLDQLVAYFEEAAKNDPQNPDAEVDLGNAYLQKIFEAGGGPQAGVWAGKADKAFDQALTINPEHWEARFTKAVSLSFWPAFTGKPQEAVKNFETLIEQQEGKNPEPHYAQTYLILGNLYEQQGKSDKAQEVWKKGLAAFPDNADIKKKTEGAGRH